MLWKTVSLISSIFTFKYRLIHLLLAGIPLEKATGSNTSVHVGSLTRDYEIMLSRDPEMQAQYKATGTPLTMLANRISWFYDFTGPSIALDTACSSSLNALHLACHCLRSGESRMVRCICVDLRDIWMILTGSGNCCWLQSEFRSRHNFRLGRPQISLPR